MRIERDGDAMTVVMSRRNLLSLLAKLDGHPPNSSCTIGCPPHYGEVWVKAEEDDVHYANPERVAVVGAVRHGTMHPDTEAAL